MRLQRSANRRHGAHPIDCNATPRRHTAKWSTSTSIPDTPDVRRRRLKRFVIALGVAAAAVVAVGVGFTLGAERLGAWFFDREEKKLVANQAGFTEYESDAASGEPPSPVW